MVEEAVGVSTYETKKKHNMAKIIKCDKSLAENKMLIESIGPKKKQLAEEKTKLIKYRDIQAKYEKDKKIFTAYCYLNDKQLVDNADKNIAELEEEINEKESSNTKLDEEQKKLSDEIKTLQNRLSEEQGGDLKKLEQELVEKRAAKDRIATDRKLQTDERKKEEDQENKLKKNFEKESKAAEKRKQDFENASENLENLRNEHAANEANLAKAHSNYEVALGLGGGDGQDSATLGAQLRNAQNELSEAVKSENFSKQNIESKSKEVAQKKHQIRAEKEAYDKSQREIELHTREADALQRNLEQINFDEEHFEELKARINNMKKEVQKEKEHLEQLYGADPRLRFNYTKPFPSFNSADVNGLVCELFSPKNLEEHSLAIEKACSGKLYNVVVSNDGTAKALLSHGRIRERRTFLPVNKIRGKDTDRHALRVAERLVGKGNVYNAINLVNYDQQFDVVMKNVFRDTLVCPNIDMADKVAFHAEVRKKTVTYDGEIVDPSGTMTTGGSSRQQTTLNIVRQMTMVKEVIERLKIKIQQDDEEFNQLNGLYAEYSAAKKKFELKQRQIESLKTTLCESNHHMILQEIENMEKEIQEAKENMAQCAAKRVELENQVQQLKNTIENAGSNRDKAKKDAEKAIQTARKARDASKIQLEKDEKNFEVLSQEIKHNEESCASFQEKLAKIQSNIAAINERIEQYDVQINEAQKEIDVVEVQFKACQERLSAQSMEVKKRQKKVDSLKKTIEDNETKVKSLKHEIEKINIDIKTAANNLKNYEKNNSWLAEEKESFTSLESEYHVLHNNFDANGFHAKMLQLEKEIKQMSKKVNLKATGMFRDIYTECEELEKRQEIITSDRQKLYKYIEKVEKEKDSELRKAYEKINETFGAIFHTFLNYANCKLAPVNRNNIKEGLEIKVCFGNVWKDSLSELSGGQRSLVALSLVLSLLRYNPAPLYILDEVDAALDQSHTQNIGIMIRKHFSASQVNCYFFGYPILILICFFFSSSLSL